MDWVTMIWSSASGACLLLAMMHLVIWLRNRAQMANLWFFVAVVGVIGQAVCELLTMRAETVEAYSSAVRQAHLLYLVAAVGILGFIHCHFGTGRIRLLYAAIALRIIAVIANYTTGQSLHLAEIRSLDQMMFLGQKVTILGDWLPNRWVILGQASSLMALIYVINASWRLWLTGARENKLRALTLGGSLSLFIMISSIQAALVASGVLRMPFFVSLPILGMVLVMGYELSRDVLRANRLANDLKATQQRLSLAAAASRMGVWEWDISNGRILVSDEGRELYGVSKSTDVNIHLFLETLHEHDRDTVRRAMDEALETGEPFLEEYRVILPDGNIRWISATGRLEANEQGKPRLMRGVSIDSTERKLSEVRMELQRQELAHLSRVSILGEMAGTLAHELNQPLAAILSNSQVGRRTIDREPADLAEIAAILDDITYDAKRAGSIIHGMRSMLRKSAPEEFPSSDINETLQQVITLLHSEVIGRKQEIHLQLADDLPSVCAGLVEIQQVLINLIINGLDAMSATKSGQPLRIMTHAEEDGIHIRVHDSGPGIPSELMDRLFEPFFSTKPSGLGLGLSISRGIIERCGGSLTAANHPAGGAEFTIILPCIS